ncbi:hypothetical protein ACIBUY_04695 [Streptomyces sp. NPDC050085]|uniref:hypothetical protein n=1 Tax=Streptomyces sp. NPDC050085 TaxID=3365600 RepID=UPI0037BA5EF5
MTTALCPEVPCPAPLTAPADGPALTAAPRPGACRRPRTAEVAIQLPADYRAFCLLYQETYLRYAQARVSEPDSSHAIVARALGLLATHWPRALTSHPAEVAWELLGSLFPRPRGAIDSATLSMGGCEVLYRVLPANQADAVVLRHRLLLDTHACADLMGVEPFTVTCRLSLAYRSLPKTFADCLQGRTSTPR